ncbi:ABC transporter ATP-binding protein [Actibacterium ureilyticum]|uniref:ABC transporter ATP-binding protein n=1 Tax=Actibacterium ureilyticum TaxID=1590614 RepID=UPI000BAAF3C7|nr:ABC transporter ATP-binding protein [Actibacterium ureilyticum]
MALSVSGLRLALSGRPILNGIDLAIAPGQVTALIGPNGSGKSTLLRSMAGLQRPDAGQVALNGAPVATIPPRELARALAFLPQSPIQPEGSTVRSLVERGRTPYLGTFRPMTAADRRAVDRAIAQTGLGDIADRRAATLSGGQRQRAFIAMTLSQETPVLLLDEPTTYLDLPHQIELLRLVRRINREMGHTIVMVLHDINLACRHADTIVGVRDGRIVLDGPAAQVITQDGLRVLFAADLRVIQPGAQGAPIVLPE